MFGKLRRNKRGLAWIWAVGFLLTLPFSALVYFLLDYPFDLMLGQISGTYTLTGTMADAWTATHFLISYLLSFVVIFVVVWILVNSKSPQQVYY